jgi:7,8-dihydro-6-hydroxymethylpterin dimethyltransferase
MTRRNRPHEFYGTTSSVCPECLRTTEAKILLDRENDCVWLERWCPEHGFSRGLVSEDIAWYRSVREVWNKPPELPERFAGRMEHGCPWDCGLCPDHQQHTCLAVLEITEACNLQCKVCFAESGPGRTKFLELSQIEDMLDGAVAGEGELDVLQISGGEPTLHPQLMEILTAARKRPIKHLMLNTNGLVLAKDPELARKLATLGPGFEVYLQFDSLKDEVLKEIRGTALAEIHRKALQNLDAAGVSTTLVMTVCNGLNEEEIGDVLRHAATWPCVRGVTLQPVQDAGRREDTKTRRLTTGAVRRLLAKQSGIFQERDVLPVPCNSDALAMAYGIRMGGKIVPLSRHIKPEMLLEGGRSTIVFERDDDLRGKVLALLSTGIGPVAQAAKLASLFGLLQNRDGKGILGRLKHILGLDKPHDPDCRWAKLLGLKTTPLCTPETKDDADCCLPAIEVEGLDYRSVFRVLIVEFMDLENLDLRALKKSCIHFVQPDGRMIPFESYNLFHRGDRAKITAETRLRR